MTPPTDLKAFARLVRDLRRLQGRGDAREAAQLADLGRRVDAAVARVLDDQRRMFTGRDEP